MAKKDYASTAERLLKSRMAKLNARERLQFISDVKGVAVNLYAEEKIANGGLADVRFTREIEASGVDESYVARGGARYNEQSNYPFRSKVYKDYLKSLPPRDRPIWLVIAILGFGASIFFLQSNLTGNVIGSLSQNSTNLIGAGCFVLGIVGALFLFKRK